MLLATNRGVGMNIGFPDVCLTPPVPLPIPYPNFGLTVMAVPFSISVIVTGMNALNMASRILMTFGDDPGVANPVFMQAGAYTSGNPVVHVDMLPGICLLCPTTGNDFNNFLGAVLVPSIVNVLFTYAPGGAARPVAMGPRAIPDPRHMGREEVLALAKDLASVGREAGPPVTARMLSPGVGEIGIRVFSGDVPARVLGAVRALEAQGMRELVIDLRDDPGGEMNAFIELAGDFLEPGSVVAAVVDEEGDETVHRSWQERPYRFPVTIRVSRGTASAAELFAGCLAAHGRAVVVGGETYGKRVGQAVVVGPGGEARAEARVSCRLPGETGEAPRV